MRKVDHTQPLSAKAYVVIALVLIVVGIGLLLFYVYEVVPKLVEKGVQDRVFYILLFPWGLASAALLFGAMRSYARITNRRLGSFVELGGPVAFFCIVVAGGFVLLPRSESFDLTVRPYSEDGREPIITSGSITIDLGNDRRTEPIGANGEADFKGISPQLRRGSVKILPRVDGYEEVWQEHKLESNVLDLPLVREHPQALLTGSITPPPKRGENIKILVEGQKEETIPDELGRFELKVNGKAGDRVRLKVYADEKLVYDDFQTLPGPAVLKLHQPQSP